MTVHADASIVTGIFCSGFSPLPRMPHNSIRNVLLNGVLNMYILFGFFLLAKYTLWMTVAMSCHLFLVS